MLDLTIEDFGDVRVFHCTGRLVAGNDTGLRGIVTAQSGRRVVLDMARISAIDAAGLGTLISLKAWAKATRRRLKLMNVTPWVQQLLQLTRLDTAFEVCSLAEILDLMCRSANPSLAVAADVSDAANIPPPLIRHPCDCSEYRRSSV